MNTTIRDPAATLVIETASRDDIVDAASVYQAAAESLSDQLRARNPWTDHTARMEDLKQAIRALSTLLANDVQSVIVARHRGAIVGMAAVQIQPPHAHIAFFFVHPDAQNRGVGRQLLDRIHEVIAESGATVTTLASSRDPKAWQRYLRFGLHPGPPQLPFRAARPVFPPHLPTSDGSVIRPFVPDDLDRIAPLDRVVRGADRLNRIAQWLAEGSEGVVVCDHHGDVAGYGLVTVRESHGQIGPVVAKSEEEFPLLLDLVLHHAGTIPDPRQRPWRIDFSARNHLAIGPLLAAGFSAENLVNWFESSPVGQWDRYIFRDEDEL
ncbi:MAG: GNAT family N-acetyltransferase [Chloroflexota bacterium]|nr:GNAT family N-acetyltransferase [Chloroflexota bacterium]